MKLTILDGYLINPGDQSWSALKDCCEVTVYSSTPQQDVAHRIADSELVLVNRLQITREVIESCPNLVYIGTFGTGFNNIDLIAAKERGITVCNVPSYSSYAVAQHAMALLLAITNQVGQFNSYLKAGSWVLSEQPEIAAVPISELYGKTLGIIGYGNIGEKFAQMAQSFGMKVLAYKRAPNFAEQTDRLRFVPLEELYAASDVISLHCPLKEETRGMIGQESIQRMKDGVILINTARGQLLNEKDVAQALNDGKISWLGTDVLSKEPPENGHPFLSHPHCIVTPHVGWSAWETRARLIKMVTENVHCFLQGKPIHVVSE